MINNVITKPLKNTKKLKNFFYRDFYGKKILKFCIDFKPSLLFNFVLDKK